MKDPSFRGSLESWHQTERGNVYLIPLEMHRVGLCGVQEGSLGDTLPSPGVQCRSASVCRQNMVSYESKAQTEKAMAVRESKRPNGSGYGGPTGLGTAGLTFFLSHMSGTSSTCMGLLAPKGPDGRANLPRPAILGLMAVPHPL